jgi:hypothetical protein
MWFKKFDKQDAIRYSNKHYIYLLNSEYNKKNARVNKEADNLSAIL